MTKQGYSANRKMSISLWMKYLPGTSVPEATKQTIAVFCGLDANGKPDVTAGKRFLHWQIQAVNPDQGETIYIGNGDASVTKSDNDPDPNGI
jgi:hypothetical protein